MNVAERAPRRRWWSSVRARTTTAATAVVAVALVAAGLIVLVVLRDNLVESASTQAEHTARGIADQLGRGTDLTALRFPDPDDEPVQIVASDGRVLAADEELRGRPPMADFGPYAAEESGRDDDPEADEDQDDEDTEEDDDDSDEESDDDGDTRAAPEAGNAAGVAVSPDTVTAAAPSTTEAVLGEAYLRVGDATTPDHYRVAALAASTAGGQPVTVYAGAALDTADSAVADARRAMLLGLLPVLSVVAVVTWFVTRRALRPVEAIRRELAEIMHGDLSRRVPEPPARDEIALLAATTNDTLAALEQSADRQRRFIADAAHELRSPIASLRAQLEVAQAHPDLLELDGLLGDTVRLEHLATDLLLLARLDAGERPRPGRVDMAALVAGELSRRTGDRVPVETALPDEPVLLTGSGTQLARVLGNLVDNAQRHTSTLVLVSLECVDGAAVLVVADDGAGVPAADRERIFQRFVRLDEARSRDEGGAGLGLAIVRDVVERHGGSIRVEDGVPAGARFIVTIPLPR
ncbi:HAMP domain-containing sensor histidine kinase [Nocardia flavorosea]|uniref:sensor histidine kinase n=1 Tax=Nocardia flavorosea TaxID=53429 RepID=UPI002B4B883F|nr:HAMP domain-containing sensor histidine kinase [Nocardia flavorosea]